MMIDKLPDDWRNILAEEFEKDYFLKLEAFVKEERETKTIYPPADDVFNAFQFTPYAGTAGALVGARSVPR